MLKPKINLSRDTRDLEKSKRDHAAHAAREKAKAALYEAKNTIKNEMASINKYLTD